MGLLELAIGAFVIALIAGALGFSGVAQGAGTIAKVLFGLFLVIAVILVLLLVLGINLFTQASYLYPFAYPILMPQPLDSLLTLL